MGQIKISTRDYQLSRAIGKVDDARAALQDAKLLLVSAGERRDVFELAHSDCADTLHSILMDRVKID